ncbi:MAG: hypothetical protein DRQ10_05130 [Candidatus Hydrothermota bacterium]|nr:MAG: hypothetical protein DRQ10_05130 [Candidatus Hydrothermae bacterium]
METIYKMLIISMVFGIFSGYSQETFPRINGLPVRNYGDSIPWEIFEEAYLGVVRGNPFDEALFSLLNDYSDDGVCFGMSALAGIVYQEHGFMGICRPLVAYSPRDTNPGRDTLIEIWPVMKKAILVLWCRQFSPPVLRVIVEGVSQGRIKDPMATYNRVDYYLSSGEIPVIMISEILGDPDSLTELGGMHAILPYRVEDHGSTKRIYVYDPTWPYWHAPNFYNTGQNYIEVYSSSNTWSYDWPDGKHWAGFIYTVPARFLYLPETNPLLISEIAEAVGQVVINEGHVVSIKDETSGLEYRADDGSLFAKNDSVVIFRWTPINGESSTGSELYIIKGGYGHSFKFEIEPKGLAPKITVGYLRKLVTVKAYSPSTPITVRLDDFGRNEQLVQIEPKSDYLVCDIDMHIALVNNEVHTVRIRGMGSSLGAPIELAFDKNGYGITLASNIPQSVGLEFAKFDGNREIKVGGYEVAMLPFTKQKVQPTTWNGFGSTITVESQTFRGKELWVSR